MTERSPEELTVRVYIGENGDFTLYEDDGISSQYENGAWLKTNLSYREKNGIFSITVTPEGEGYDGMPTERSYLLELIGMENAPYIINCPEAEASFKEGKFTVKLPKRKWNEGFSITFKEK
jgi:hypothetical protein